MKNKLSFSNQNMEMELETVWNSQALFHIMLLIVFFIIGWKSKGLKPRN